MPDHVVFDDFSRPTSIRNCQLIVHDHSLFVNPGYLAEFSPYFVTVYEQQINPVTIQDLPYEYVLELMRVLFYCPTRKPISQGNVSMVYEAASHFEMEIIIRRCEDHIAKHVNYFTNNRLFELTQTLSKTNRLSQSLSICMDRLAHLNDHELSNLHFDEIPGDVVADLYTVKQRVKEETKMRKKKSFLSCLGSK